MNFKAKVDVKRLTDGDNGPVTGYATDIVINCTDCGLPFRFMGLEFGVSRHVPRLSVDGLELRAPIEPAYVPELLGHAKTSGRA
jgi:hypothetical protein